MIHTLRAFYALARMKHVCNTYTSITAHTQTTIDFTRMNLARTLHKRLHISNRFTYHFSPNASRLAPTHHLPNTHISHTLNTLINGMHSVYLVRA